MRRRGELLNGLGKRKPWQLTSCVTAYLIGVPAVTLAGDVVCSGDAFQVLRQPDLLAVCKEKEHGSFLVTCFVVVANTTYSGIRYNEWNENKC